MLHPAADQQRQHQQLRDVRVAEAGQARGIAETQRHRDADHQHHADGARALPGDKPLQTLIGIRDDQQTPESLKSILYEAMLEHIYRHPVDVGSPQQLPAAPAGRAVPIPVPADAPAR